MTPLLRVIPGGNADDAVPTAARSVAHAMAAEELRRLRQHVLRLEDALRAHGATEWKIQDLRFGTTPPQPIAAYVTAPLPCDRCGETGIGRFHGEVLCADHALADAEAAFGGDA